MLGLELFLTPRFLETSEIVDMYLQEIMDTSRPISWSGYQGWILCKEIPGHHYKWERFWRVWGGQYPYEWLSRIAYMDWGILTPQNFEDVPWVTVVAKKMPSRKMSFKFWWWLKEH